MAGLQRVLGDLGANPIETITNTTGIWTLRFIVITLAITPIRWLTKWNPIITFRRMIGLFAFFYGTIHFSIYFVLDRSLMFDGLWEDIVKRPYITVGFTGFVLMIPLALTSTKGWIRRLGGQRWNLLHKLVYITGRSRRDALLVEGQAGCHQPDDLRGHCRGPAQRARLARVAEAVDLAPQTNAGCGVARHQAERADGVVRYFSAGCQSMTG